MQKKIITRLPLSTMYAVNLFATSAIFFLGSCCFMPINQTAKKPCNCNSEKNVALVNQPESDKHLQPDSVDLQTIRTGNTLSPAAEHSFFPTDSEQLNAYYLNRSTPFFSTATPSTLKLPAANSMDATTASFEPVFLQPKTEKKMPLGIKKITSHLLAGPNISFKNSKEDYGNTAHKHKPGVGFQAGIRSEYYFSDKFAVLAGLIFKQNNASEELSYNSPGEPGGGNYNENSTTKYQYNYLSAPILAVYNVSEQFSVAAGPELNYLVGASHKTDDGDKESLTKNSTKFGVGVQAAVKYKFAGAPIAIELLYDHRISRLNEKATDYYPGSSYENPAWNMKGIQLNIVCALCELLKKR